MTHTRAKVVAEILSGSFSSIECSVDQCNFTNVFNSKFGTAKYIVLLQARCLEIGVSYVGCEDVQPVQCGISKRDTYTFSRDNSCIRRSNRIGSFMSFENPPGFSCNIHFYVPDQVSGDL
jgi:hypothetical protein